MRLRARLLRVSAWAVLVIGLVGGFVLVNAASDVNFMEEAFLGSGLESDVSGLPLVLGLLTWFVTAVWTLSLFVLADMASARAPRRRDGL